MPVKNSLSQKLNAIKKQWQAAVPAEGGLGVPEGVYQCKVAAIAIEESKKSQRLQVVMDLVVLAGDFAGKKIKRFVGLDTEKGFGILKMDMLNCGVEPPEDAAALPEELAKIVDATVEISVRQNGEYTNVFVNRLLEEVEAEDGELAAAAETANKRGGRKSAGAKAEKEEEAEEGEGGAALEGADLLEALSEVDVSSMGQVELLELLDGVEALREKVRGAEKMRVPALRKAIGAAVDELIEELSAEGEADNKEADGEEWDLATMTKAEMLAFAEAEELVPVPKLKAWKLMKEDVLRRKIEELLEA